MQPATKTSSHDSSSSSLKPSHYDHELGLQLLQTFRDEQALEEYNLLSVKFSRWPYKLYQVWLVLSFIDSLITVAVTIIIPFIDPIAPQLLLFYLGCIIDGTGLLFVLYGCGQMFYAIRQKKAKIAQKGLRKFQYSMMNCLFGLFLALCILQIGDAHPVFNLFGGAVFFVLVFIPVSNLVAGYAVVKAFKECQEAVRENMNDVSRFSEETDPHVVDFLKQNEVLQEEMLKYDEQLERFWVKVYRCWLRLVKVFEILRIFWYVIFFLPFKDDDSWRKYAMTGLFLQSLSCIYSCFKMESAIAKKILSSSETAVKALKACIIVSVISYVLAVRWIKGKFIKDDEPWKDFVLLNLILFGYCCFVPVVTFLGALRVHKILKERDDYAKFSSMNGVSSNF